MTRENQPSVFDPVSTATLFELRRHYPQLSSSRLWPAFMRALRALSLGEESCSVEERAIIGQALAAFTLLACARWHVEDDGVSSATAPAVLAARVQELEATLVQLRHAIATGDLDQLDLFADGLMATAPTQLSQGATSR